MIAKNKILRNVYQYTLGYIESLLISFKSFDKQVPILIYQMGKVGSSSVDNSLKRCGIKNPVYHIHFFSNTGIAVAETYYKSINTGLPRHLQRSKILRKKTDLNEENKWIIISIVRDPIAREISSLFQNIKDIKPEFIDKKGAIDYELVSDHLVNKFKAFDENTDFSCTWFDKEINKSFNTDIYLFPFNMNRGYQIIRVENVEILILRMEDMDSCFESALADFLNRESIKMRKKNIADKKSYSNVYSGVVSNIKLPREICETIYSSKYVRHFYSDQMINNLIKKWSK